MWIMCITSCITAIFHGFLDFDLWIKMLMIFSIHIALLEKLTEFVHFAIFVFYFDKNNLFFLCLHKKKANFLLWETCFLFQNPLYEWIKYLSTLVMAFAPTPAAVMSWRSCFVRTSPATKIPGALVTPVSSATT